jgi:hypothetical protein
MNFSESRSYRVRSFAAFAIFASHVIKCRMLVANIFEPISFVNPVLGFAKRNWTKDPNYCVIKSTTVELKRLLFVPWYHKIQRTWLHFATHLVTFRNALGVHSKGGIILKYGREQHE